MTLPLIALNHAQSQNGVQEIPKNTNSGQAVEKYLLSVGLGKGYAWCMAFVYWCVSMACKDLKIENPLKRTAGVLDMWNSKPELRVVGCPKPGDIFIMDFGNGTGHAGFVIAVMPGNILKTIEGNTNDEGSREGYEVCIRHDRKVSQMKGFLRLKTN
ncbi:hypothetical protein FNO01nite_30460 [Flavobacterium noncentrifugens]|uniref:CHAP domain-containing protein n=1 Tax=Flavobacterium noncentrifugens TaxID=1128970 RepID=A0A1G9BVE6_9FLAO|nr:CHAP domain-containing protein [Flavobacterium noncentrifugens]GEP52374.1 hypothetical protein FNO01nite_30460 [Flavobacterium noncentrifugens]SDK43134.1 CHAP domain-containing protein [Flavobacterium noncentrifugens]